MILDDKPGMLKSISLVVRDPHVKALATVADDAVIAPQRTLPFNVIKFGPTLILSAPFSCRTKLFEYGLFIRPAPGVVAPSEVEKRIWLSSPH